MKKRFIQDYQMLTKTADFGVKYVGRCSPTSAAAEIVAGLD